MSDKPAVCVQIEDDLLATAMNEAPPGAARRVERHLAACATCRGATASIILLNSLSTLALKSDSIW